VNVVQATLQRCQFAAQLLLARVELEKKERKKELINGKTISSIGMD
jgi:hypothetical protein